MSQSLLKLMSFELVMPSNYPILCCPLLLPLSIFTSIKVKGEVAQSCLTLCDPMDYSLPGSSVHGVLQARVLEWVAISFSRRSSQLRDWTQASHIVGRHFTIWATRDVKFYIMEDTESCRGSSPDPYGYQAFFLHIFPYTKGLRWFTLSSGQEVC